MYYNFILINHIFKLIKFPFIYALLLLIKAHRFFYLIIIYVIQLLKLILH